MTSTLPQLDRLFLTDAGLETDLIFNRGVEMRSFASITLLETAAGRGRARALFPPVPRACPRTGTGLILESASWRASPDWAEPLGFSGTELDRLNRLSDRHAAAPARRISPTFRSSSAAASGRAATAMIPGGSCRPTKPHDYHAHQAATLADGGRRPADRTDHDQQQRSDRRCPRRPAAGNPRRDQLHGRNRRRTSRPASRSPTPSPRSMRRPAIIRPISWSIAPTRRISKQQLLSGGEWIRRVRGVQRQRLALQPRRARRDDHPRRRQSAGTRRAISRPAREVAAIDRARRLLRHRLSPHRGDRRGGSRGRPSAPARRATRASAARRSPPRPPRGPAAASNRAPAAAILLADQQRDFGAHQRHRVAAFSRPACR